MSYQFTEFPSPRRLIQRPVLSYLNLREPPKGYSQISSSLGVGNAVLICQRSSDTVRVYYNISSEVSFSDRPTYTSVRYFYIDSFIGSGRYDNISAGWEDFGTVSGSHSPLVNSCYRLYAVSGEDNPLDLPVASSPWGGLVQSPQNLNFDLVIGSGNAYVLPVFKGFNFNSESEVYFGFISIVAAIFIFYMAYRFIIYPFYRRLRK